MPNVILNQGFINNIVVNKPDKAITCYFDEVIPGFYLEYRKSGNGTFYFKYRDEAARFKFARIGSLEKMSLMEAREKAYELKKIVDEGGDPKEKNENRAPILRDFIENRYMPFVKMSKRSWATDKSLIINHIMPEFGSIKMNKISKSSILKLQLDMKNKEYSAGTCNRVVILLRFIFNCAIRWEISAVAANPCAGVKLFDDHAARERYLIESELHGLFDELDRNENVQVGKVIKLLVLTGARKREILDAKWTDIDHERKILTVPASRSKSKRPRHIPLSDLAMTVLAGIARDPEIPFIFFNPRTRRPPVSIFYAWDSIRRKLGLSDLRLHDLRHSYASFLINAGRSLYEVQTLLGHSDPKVTMRYAHLSPQAMRDAANLVGRIAERHSDET